MLIIIYVGAITILFLFVVMMLDITVTVRNQKDFYNYLFFAGFILLTFCLITFLSTISLLNKNILGQPVVAYTEWVILVDHITNTGTIGQILYTFYSAYFLMAGLVLLIPLIGAVTLTHQIHTKNNVDTSTFKQISRLKNNSIFNIEWSPDDLRSGTPRSGDPGTKKENIFQNRSFLWRLR